MAARHPMYYRHARDKSRAAAAFECGLDDEWKVVDKKSGVTIKPGDVLTDFRGDKVKFKRIVKPPASGGGSLGKIETDDGVFYPSAFGLKIVHHSGLK